MAESLYFPQDEPRLRALLDSFLSSLADDLAGQTFRGDVRALLLAGGYGRGEGGIFQEEGGLPQLYNDLEFYLVIRDGADAAPVEKWCAGQAHRGDELLKIEVEFKVLRESALRNGTPSMFFYDLVAAHRLVFGAADFVASLPATLLDPVLIPGHEATRLLFNRGTGLFFSRVALERGDARVTDGFIERNHAKVRLALADAVLAVNGRYHYSCRERHERLAEPLANTPPDWATLVQWHEAGVDFKLHPRHRNPSATGLKQAQEEVTRVWLTTFLWLESHRLGETFDRADRYAEWKGRLFPETRSIRNLALHLRDRLRRGSALPGWLDYPRAALQRALVLLLEPGGQTARPSCLLGLPATASLSELHGCYEGWWKFYN